MFEQKFDKKKLLELIGMDFDGEGKSSQDYNFYWTEIYRELLKDKGATGLGIQERRYKDPQKTEFNLVCHGKKNRPLSEMLQEEVTRLKESLGKKKKEKIRNTQKKYSIHCNVGQNQQFNRSRWIHTGPVQ